MKLSTPAYITAGDEVVGPVATVEEFRAVVEDFRSRGIHELHSTPIDVVCDFCSFPVVRWRYQIPAGGVVVAVETAGRSETHLDEDGLWGACDACHEFIQEGDWEKLALRSVQQYQKAHPESQVPISLLALGITGSHQYFANGWDGSDPDPVVPDIDLMSQ